MSSVATHILALPPWIALAVVFVMPALESSAFVGFVFPGEIALMLGGVLASQGRLPLPAVLAAGIAGAIAGDSIGYAVGRRYGRRMLTGTLGRWVRDDHLDRAEAYLGRRGGRAVFFGRFTAALRVMIPSLAGMARLRYRTFLGYNLSSAVCWGTLTVMLGYLAGASWHRVEHLASRIGFGLLGLLLVFLVGRYLLRRHGSPWMRARFAPASKTGLPLTVAVAVAVAATWTFLGLTQDVLGHEEVALLDPHLHAWVVDHRVAALTVLFKAATWLGASVVTVPLLVVGGTVLVRRRHSWAPAIDIAVVYVVAVFLHALVGEIVERHRPPRSSWLVSAEGWSYPSGHTTQAVAAWGVLALLLATGASTRTRVVVTSVAVVAATLVAASRIYLGVHWPTDVLGGALMSVAVLATWTVARRTAFAPRGFETARPGGSPPQPTEGRLEGSPPQPAEGRPQPTEGRPGGSPPQPTEGRLEGSPPHPAATEQEHGRAIV